MPTLYQVVDAVLARALGGFLDAHFRKLPGVYIGCLPRTQTLEVAAGVSLMFDKGRGNFSRACAESDIANVRLLAGVGGTENRVSWPRLPERRCVKCVVQQK